VDFGLMFFASRRRAGRARPYQLMLDAARAADRDGLRCVWTPERHFDRFGGLFPDPAITSAALATITERVQLRAGSAISPLHDVVRLAEDWSMVDNLSNGRVAISFGSGWNVNDFVFFPDRYRDRQQVMARQIEEMRALWRGDAVMRTNSFGKEVAITLQPPPVQPELPVWITSSGNPRTFASAGACGANVLTHLIGQDTATLAGKIQIYRDARRDAGLDPDAGIVSLMLHTFLAESDARARDEARDPLCDYLLAAAALERRAASGGGTISCGHQLPTDAAEQTDEALDRELAALACERYLDGASLIGSIDSCETTVARFAALGVNEIACLIDFGVADQAVLEGLAPLAALSRRCADHACAPIAQAAGAGEGRRL
jgi:natural product biosynthesis luciferase-like monooxygenase protein